MFFSTESFWSYCVHSQKMSKKLALLHHQVCLKSTNRSPIPPLGATSPPFRSVGINIHLLPGDDSGGCGWHLRAWETALWPPSEDLHRDLLGGTCLNPKLGPCYQRTSYDEAMSVEHCWTWFRKNFACIQHVFSTWGCEQTFAALRSKAYSGIKLSSAGLVFKHFGGKVGTRRTSQLDSLEFH